MSVGEVYCAAHDGLAKRDRGRAADAVRSERPWRKWYNRKAWKIRRAEQLAREPLCRMCPDWSRRPATIADHVVPHRGDYALFWYGELQSLCKCCHDGRKQRQERREERVWGGQNSPAFRPQTGAFR